MAQRHRLNERRRKLDELGDILHSMKTLAVMETHKLDRVMAAQLAMTASIEKVAEDFLRSYPQVLPQDNLNSHIVVLIGSQRGFCGNFNEQLVYWLEQSPLVLSKKRLTLVAIGAKLHPLLEQYDEHCIYVEGVDVTEEVSTVAGTLIETLAACPQPASLTVLYHREQNEPPVDIQLLPPFRQLCDTRVHDINPPMLNLSPMAFFLALSEHYLFSALHQLLFTALMAENQQRISHLELAARHLDDKTEALKLKINAMRQEEIIEEIEVILLNDNKVGIKW